METAKDKVNTEKAEKGSRLPFWLVLLGIAVAAEIVVFNFRSIQSLFYQPLSYPVEEMHYDGVTCASEGSFVLAAEGDEGMLYLHSLQDFFPEVTIHNVCLDLVYPEAIDHPYGVSGCARVITYIRDEGHDQYMQLPERIIRNDIPVSRYLWIQGDGKIRTLAFRISLTEGKTFCVREILLNAREPLHFSLIRTVILWLLLLTFYGFYQLVNKYEVTGKVCGIAFCVVGAAILLTAGFLITSNEQLGLTYYFRPYQNLTEALCAGQFSLLQEPSEALKNMENPYDYTLRTALGLEEGADYLWDTAYYNGKYYIYFGIVPCLLFYLPWYLLFGKHITDAAVIWICALIFYTGAVFLTAKTIKDRKLPFWMQLLMSTGIFLGSGMMTCLGSPDAHDVPRMVGICFVIWGIGFWLCAAEKTKRQRLYLALGAFLMALSVGCRPNLVLYFLMAIPILYSDFTESSQREKMEKALGFVLPILPVALGLMWYNYARFGSVTDFGFAWNLTVRDCRRNVFSLDKPLIGFYEAILKAPALNYRFPFLSFPQQYAEQDLFGHTEMYITCSYGGLLWCAPILFMIPGIFGKKKDYVGITALSIGMAQLVLSSLSGGSSYNYNADFYFLLIYAAWLGAIRIREQLCAEYGEKGSAFSLYRAFLLIVSVISVLYFTQFFFLSTLDAGNTALYYRIYYGFNFW